MADLSSRSSTPRRTYDESLCFASASQFIMSVLLKASLCIVPWCLLTMCAWFVVWSAVNRKVWRSLFLSVCDAVGQDQLWKESVLIVLFQASLSVWQYLANNDGLSLELSWQVLMQFVWFFFSICDPYFVFQSGNVALGCCSWVSDLTCVTVCTSVRGSSATSMLSQHPITCHKVLIHPESKSRFTLPLLVDIPDAFLAGEDNKFASWLLLCNSRKLEKWLLVKLPKCVYGTKVFFFLFCSVFNDGNIQLKELWLLEESKNISAAINHCSFYAGVCWCLTDVWDCSKASPGGDLSSGTLRWANMRPAFPFFFFFWYFLLLLHLVAFKLICHWWMFVTWLQLTQ